MRLNLKWIKALTFLVLFSSLCYAENYSTIDSGDTVLNNKLRKLDIAEQIRTNNGLDLQDTKITSVATPTASTDGVNKAYVDARLPAGVIMLWSGSEASIPTGWVLCDGSNSTPDLRDKFIVGAGDTYDVDDTGGATTHTHDQNVGTSNAVADGGNVIGASAVSGADMKAPGGGAVTLEEMQSGVQAASSLPPYYALCYIMKE